MQILIKYFTYSLLLAITFSVSEAEIECPDHKSQCPEGTTCCQLESGDYGCCPMPNAVCCSDHRHCCPHATVCDLQHLQCVNGHERLPIHRKFTVLQSKTIVTDNGPDSVGTSKKLAFPPLHHHSHIFAVDNEVVCPGGKQKCPAHTTCCPLEARRRKSKKVAWLLSDGDSSSAITEEHKMGTSYGCCPAEQAVCCEDHLHCCPHGTTCDTQHSRCIGGSRGELSRPWYEKFAATDIQRKAAIGTVPSFVVCANYGHVREECAKGKCCLKEINSEGSTKASCCPFADGTCCISSDHCCPKGFSCAEQGACISKQNGLVLSTQLTSTSPTIIKKIVSLKTRKNGKICPDGSSCDSASDTCCPIDVRSDGMATAFECCPLNKGNCCASGSVCCPRGYKCVGRRNCEKMALRELIAQLLLN